MSTVDGLVATTGSGGETREGNGVGVDCVVDVDDDFGGNGVVDVDGDGWDDDDEADCDDCVDDDFFPCHTFMKNCATDVNNDTGGGSSNDCVKVLSVVDDVDEGDDVDVGVDDEDGEVCESATDILFGGIAGTSISTATAVFSLDFSIWKEPIDE